MRIVARCALLVALSTAVTECASAQSFSNADIDRYYRPGVYVPHGAGSFSDRYNFDRAATFFYPGYDAQRLLILDYLDRQDRAEKFGYAPPGDPYVNPTSHPPAWKFGTGWRLFRRR